MAILSFFSFFRTPRIVHASLSSHGGNSLYGFRGEMNLDYYGVLLKACRNLLAFAAIFLHLGPCFSFCCISYDLMLLMGDIV